MADTNIEKRFRDSVETTYSDAYATRVEAFAHVAVREYFGLDGDEALEYCAVGSVARDRGLHALWFDEEEDCLVVVRALWSPKAKVYSAREVLAAEDALAWFRALGPASASGGVDARLVDAAARLQRVRTGEPKFETKVHVIAFGTFSPGAQEDAARLNDEHRDEHATFKLVPFEDVLAGLEERLAREVDTDIGPAMVFSIDQGAVFEHGKNPKALVATLSASELAEAARSHGHRLFRKNLRYQIPGRSKVSVNAGIARTLETADGRGQFWYYNNGIAIVCDSYELDRESGTVALVNMQIVNGAQTTSTLAARLPKGPEGAEAQVLARIIEAPDDDLKQHITYYNNRQNAVKDRDLQANDTVQDRLHAEFQTRSDPWFYERKNGEWNALTADDKALKADLKSKRINNEKAAQDAYAFYFDAGRARADKKALFQSRKDGGFYEDVFNESTTTAGILVPFLIGEHVRAEKAEYLKSVRGITDERSATADEKRLLSRQWIKFADQYLVGTIALFLERRGGYSTERLEELLAGPFDEMVRGAYSRAALELRHVFVRLQREARQNKEPFSAANYVKSYWDDVREDILDTLDSAEEVEDPLRGVPMLQLSEAGPAESDDA